LLKKFKQKKKVGSFMKKMSLGFLAALLLTNCTLINLLKKNQSPYFLDAFIPMHQSEMISYKDLQLNWEAVDPEQAPLFYDVYFGKAGDPLKQISKRQTEHFYPMFFTLEAETNYRWKIVAFDGRNTVESDTLAFQTSYYFPDWWAKQNETGSLYYFGIATHEFQRYAYALAEENAQKSKREFLEKVVRDDMNRFVAEAGIMNETLKKMAEQVIQIVSNHDYSESKVDLQETKSVRRNFYRTYIRVEIPRGEYERKLIATIRNARFLYEELGFSNSFRKMDLEYK
jgi:hypothetical protein